MRFLSPPRRVLACVAAAAGAAAAVGCESDGSTRPEDSPVPNFVRLQSDAGDVIGGGRSYSYGGLDAHIRVLSRAGAAAREEGGAVLIAVEGDESWIGVFQGPAGFDRLRPGSYAGLLRYGDHDPGTGGLHWVTEERACAALTGSFTIDSLAYVGSNLASIDLRFEQHCEGAAPALRGTIHWRADDPRTITGPVYPLPAGLWQPPPAATPASGDYVYLESDAGEYVGGGRTYLYRESTDIIKITADGGLAQVLVGGWVGMFKAMNVLSQLEPGYYSNLQDYPFHNVWKGGLSWTGRDVGCDSLRGWFAVDAVTYTGKVVTALEMRFEQRCGGQTPALRGKIRWSA